MISQMKNSGIHVFLFLWTEKEQPTYCILFSSQILVVLSMQNWGFGSSWLSGKKESKYVKEYNANCIKIFCWFFFLRGLSNVNIYCVRKHFSWASYERSITRREKKDYKLRIQNP